MTNGVYIYGLSVSSYGYINIESSNKNMDTYESNLDEVEFGADNDETLDNNNILSEEDDTTDDQLSNDEEISLDFDNIETDIFGVDIEESAVEKNKEAKSEEDIVIVSEESDNILTEV